MAPEQARGGTVSAAGDLFSLGCVLYRLATGEAPFKGPDALSTLLAVIGEEPASPQQLNPDMSPQLTALVLQLLSKDPEKRPTSALAVADALKTIEAEQAPAGPRKWGLATPARPGKGKSRPRRWVPLLLGLGLAGLPALVALGWWVAAAVLPVETANGTLLIKIPDEKTEAAVKNVKLILTDADDKVRYALVPRRGERTIEAGSYRIRVEGVAGLTLDPPEFTLEKDGQVTVRVTAEPKVVVKNLDPDLTAAEYVLSLGGSVQVNGEERDIKKVSELPQGSFRLTAFDLQENAQVSDAGLARFNDCKHLTRISLDETPVTDVGLAHFQGCKDLRILGLRSASHVTDAGLACFRDCWKLTGLWLGFTQVTDAGLAHFKDCKQLTHLDLGSTQVTDAGLAYFQGCRKLTHLDLWSCGQVSDASMTYFKDCKDFTYLNLHGTQVSDVGVANLQGCKALTWLNLFATRVSDEGLSNLKECKGLGTLWLGDTKVSDEGLAHFKDCKGLTNLNLANTQVTDVGLAYFQGCKDMTYLDLGRTQVSDAGLAHFKDCKNLTFLGVNATQVTDLAFLQGTPLKELRCSFRRIRDGADLRSIKTLETINGKPAKKFWAEVNARKK
jgi:uncharacterized membrane protein